jgi:hypothetical protein
MTTFELVTHSVFEHIYLVEADTLSDAINKVEKGDINDYVQKHLAEKVICSHGMVEDIEHKDWLAKQHEQGFF